MKIKKGLLIAFGVFFGMLFLVIGVFAFMKGLGKSSLYDKNKTNVPTLSGEEISEEEKEPSWQEGDIRYNGKIYRYNDQMLTFLLLGIDEEGKVVKKKNDYGGGQSDTIMLLCIDPMDEKISLIAINRDTMTEIDIYSSKGNYISTIQAQLTLQHGYGDGAELSCERTLASVQKLFFNIPIHGYCSINMGAVAVLNDAVGGIEVTPTQNMDTGNYYFQKDKTVILNGKKALAYLRYRDKDALGSAGERLNRQKQYLLSYTAKAKESILKDPALVLDLYNTISKYMVTDVSIDEALYLLDKISGYTFEQDYLYSLQGETVAGEKYEEFYPDEEALYELILQVFYKEVTESESGIQP